MSARREKVTGIEPVDTVSSTRLVRLRLACGHLEDRVRHEFQFLPKTARCFPCLWGWPIEYETEEFRATLQLHAKP